MTSMQKLGSERFLKFVTCLRILLFLNNSPLVIFVDGADGEGKKIGYFLWTS